MNNTAAVETLTHLFRVTGLGDLLATGRLRIEGNDATASAVDTATQAGSLVVALNPAPTLVHGLGGSSAAFASDSWSATFLPASSAAFARIRGFGGAYAYRGEKLEPVLSTQDGAALWAWRAIGKGGVLLIGSDLVGDILRFRQGDARRRPSEKDFNKHGYSGERADYLFEPDIDASAPHDRPADWPLFAIRSLVLDKLGSRISGPLPNGAACALVITGDTDVATAEHYARQRELLGDLPITYFLRTACSVNADVLGSLESDPCVDLQLHPDALDDPRNYGPLLKAQSDRFETVVGRRAWSLRNHGYLNDGYWGHAEHWENNGYTWSANIAGVGGLVLNGSLLPARLQLNGRLTRHWSVLTSYGDGMIYALKLSDTEAGARMEAHVDEIVRSGVPGVVAINLHPVNVGDTPEMHRALHRIVEKGALPWSMAQCAGWFEALDQ